MSRKEQIKELFSFTKSERNGIIVLLFLIFITFTINVSIDFQDESKADFEKFKNEIAEFEAGLVPKDEKEYLNRLDKYIVERYDTLKLFDFDPNTTIDADWQKLGLTEKQISTVRNYLSKGGKFFETEDFKKLYGIRTKQYEILKPYIKILGKSKKADKQYISAEKDSHEIELFYFNPNTIEKDQLLKLGFNSKEASLIIKFREKGGTFRKPEDLMKIYGMRPEQFSKIKDFIQIEERKQETKTDTGTAEHFKPKIKVDLNTISLEELDKMGGFWKYNSKKIIEFRTKIGAFVYKEQLLHIKGMSPDYFEKMKESISLSTGKTKIININTATRDEFKTNPYFTEYLIYKIIRYREKNNKFKKVEELLENKYIEQEQFNTLKYYIKAN